MANNRLESNRFYDLEEVNKNNPITISGNGQNSSKSQLLLFVVVFSFLVILSTSLALYFTPKNTFNTRLNNDNSNEKPTISDSYRTGASNIPKVINVPPSYGYVGEEYVFVPKIQDANSKREEIEVFYISGPAWLTMKDGRFSGTPTVQSEAAEKVEYELFDRTNRVEKEFYIFVYPSREVVEEAN